MSLYRIYHPATQRVVNLYTSAAGSVNQGTPLSLYPWENNADQKFEMEYYDTSVIFRIKRAPHMVINRNVQTNAAMVWPFDTSPATLNDSLIDTETENGNMRIKLVRQHLYLTKDANSYMLYWKAKSANDKNQFFKLEQVDSTSSGNTCLPCHYTGYGFRYGKPDFNGKSHYAIDLVNGMNTPIYAWCDGVIARKLIYNKHNMDASGNDSLGNCLFLHSKNPNTSVNSSTYVRAIYAHLHSFANGINVNTAVKAGQLIGYMGQTGAASGPHLHFSLQCANHYTLDSNNNRYEHANWVNPASYLPEIDTLNP